MINTSRISNMDKTIWRYMDLSKFERLLEDNGNLYFTRSDKFEDSLEGKYSEITLKELEEKYLKLHGEILVENWKKLDMINAVRRNSLVSCWHINEHENIDMWNTYAKEKEAIVIKTSINKLYESLNISKNMNFNIDIGEVVYIDFHNTSLEYKNHIIEPLFFKDKKYEFENELRVVVWKRPQNNILNTDLNNFYVCHGGSLNIDLNILIDEIYISPNSSDDLIKKNEKMIPDNMKNKVILKSVLK